MFFSFTILSSRNQVDGWPPASSYVYVDLNKKKVNPYCLPGNYVSLEIRGKKFYDVAQIPRYVLDNEQYVYTMEEGKLARLKVDVITIQGDVAISKHSVPDNMKLITTYWNIT